MDVAKVFEAPWLVVTEDPLTGLPNMLALMSDLPGPDTSEGGVAVGFDMVGLRGVNMSQGVEAGDRTLTAFARAMKMAVGQLGVERARLYRLGGDEFCALIPGSREAGLRLVKAIEAQGCAPKFRYSIVEFSRETGSSEEAFFDIWGELQRGLSYTEDRDGDPMRHVAIRLAEQIRETIGQLKATKLMAYTDDISGLPNHRAARFLLTKYLNSLGDGSKLSLLFVDGDNLRQYNDTLGYEPGNEMIRNLASVLRRSVLPTEFVARWLSGDEFLIILPECDKARAVRKAQEVCGAVERESVSWIYPITVSIGVATFPDDAADLEGLICQVEKANAQAKSSGKNRVCAV